jgi:hypothetical protein
MIKLNGVALALLLSAVTKFASAQDFVADPPAFTPQQEVGNHDRHDHTVICGEVIVVSSDVDDNDAVNNKHHIELWESKAHGRQSIVNDDGGEHLSATGDEERNNAGVKRFFCALKPADTDPLATSPRMLELKNVPETFEEEVEINRKLGNKELHVHNPVLHGESIVLPSTYALPNDILKTKKQTKIKSMTLALPQNFKVKTHTSGKRRILSSHNRKMLI